MLPVLSHFESLEDLNIFVTTDGVSGVGFELSPCDLEVHNSQEFFKRLTQVLKQLDPKILARIQTDQETSHDLGLEFPRSAALNSLGFKTSKVSLLLEFQDGLNPLKEIKNILFKSETSQYHEFEYLRSAIQLFQKNGFKLKPFSSEETSSLFDRGRSAWVRSAKSIETGSESIGVVRITKHPNGEFSKERWAKVLEKLPKPFSVHMSFQRMDEARARILLEKKRNQTAAGKDITSKAQVKATEGMILQNFEEGSQIFETELLISLKRPCQASLSQALGSCASEVSMFAESLIETLGVAPSFIATRAGSPQHVSVLESEEALAALLPLWQNGEEQSVIQPERSVTFQRTDKSLYHFDLFNPEFTAFNAIVAGVTGKGKSVLTGLLTSSLLNDPKNRVIKLDVGGSHSKECELFGGTEYQMSLDKPSGINPFEVIGIAASESDKIAILSKFLSSLIQEQGEITLAKSIRAEIEDAVRNYVESKPREPSLDDFCICIEHFPRKDLLKRWARGGLYENAFASSAESQQLGAEVNSSAEGRRLGAEAELVQLLSSARPFSGRLAYYNFSQIFQAADPEFAQAAIAAVLAQFNMEMLVAHDTRLVLICDETPFFIKSCFDFFKFSTANVRKFGHAIVPIVQLTSQLVVDGDTGIFDHCPQRFLFSIDGEEEEFQRRLSLRDQDMESIRNLQSIVGQHSEVLLQTGDVTRKLHIKVTPEEYWRLTTSRTDKDKLMNLMQAVPGLSLREAIRCLSHGVG